MDNLAREHIDINTLRLLYTRHKGFIAPFLVIVVVVILFAKITIPSIQDLLKGYEEQKVAIQTLENLRGNLNFVKSLDNSSLTSQFNLMTKALPIVKDFDSVLNAISDSSNKSGIAIGGFKFVVGDLSKEEEGNEYPTLNVSLSLIGGAEAVDKFIGSLTKVLPLSEITKTSSQKDTSIVAIDFYYKLVKPSKNNDSLPINPVSAKGLSLINELSAFSIPEVQEVQSSDLTPSSTSTSFANPFF